MEVLINGVKVPLWFGMWFTEVFGDAIQKIQPFTQIGFGVELIWSAHQNHVLSFGGSLLLQKHEIFAWVESSFKDEEKAKELAKAIDAYNQSDFAKAVAAVNEKQGEQVKKKKATGTK